MENLCCTKIANTLLIVELAHDFFLKHRDSQILPSNEVLMLKVFFAVDMLQ